MYLASASEPGDPDTGATEKTGMAAVVWDNFNILSFTFSPKMSPKCNPGETEYLRAVVPTTSSNPNATPRSCHQEGRGNDTGKGVNLMT